MTCEDERSRGKALRLALSKGSKSGDEDGVRRICAEHGGLVLPGQGWWAQKESDKSWRAILSMGVDGADGTMGLWEPSAKRKNMVCACARGLKDWGYAEGSRAGDAWARRFARERLLWHGEENGEGLAAMLCANEMMSGDPEFAWELAVAMGQSLEGGALDNPPQIALTLRARALTLRAQSMPDPLAGRAHAMDEAYYLACRDALLGRWVAAMDMVHWVRTRSKAWAEHPEGGWLGLIVAWVGEQGLMRANTGDLSRVMAVMGVEACGRATRFWESSDAPKGLSVLQSEVVARAQSEAIRGSAGFAPQRRARSSAI